MATRTVSLYSFGDDVYDNYFYDVTPSKNNSTQKDLFVGWTNVKITSTWRVLLRFPMDWATVNAFDSVILRLYVSSTIGSEQFNINTINNSWVSGIDSWKTRTSSQNWNQLGGDFNDYNSIFYTFTSTGWSENDVTTQVNDIRSGESGVDTDVATLFIKRVSELGAVSLASFTSSAEAQLFSPQLVFTWTVPLVSSLVSPKTKNIKVIQSNVSTLSINKVQHTSFKSQNVSSTLSGKHKETQYQIFENHIPASGSPLINLKSSSNIRKNGNILKLTKNELKMYLKGNTYYKIRMRFRDSSGWTNWTPLNSFKTRDKDYKRG